MLSVQDFAVTGCGEGVLELWEEVRQEKQLGKRLSFVICPTECLRPIGSLNLWQVTEVKVHNAFHRGVQTGYAHLTSWRSGAGRGR